jgi:hypothetical protein
MGDIQMGEIAWTRRICNEMKACNALVFACVGGPMQEPGWPDRYVHHTYWSGWLEFKGVRTTVKLKQKIILRKLGRCGYVARQPNRIETADGKLVALFDGTGLGLLKCLRDL